MVELAGCRLFTMEEQELTGWLNSYNYRNRAVAKRDILSTLRHYRGLHLRYGKYTFNDGTQKDLVSLSGTIPVPYMGATYNIPVMIYVLDTHPMHAPVCYVCPTQDMEIRVSRHVDHNGRIYLPYLHEWNEANSDLLGLVQVCVITFSEQPPVFSRPANQAYPPQPAQPPPYPPQQQQPQPPPQQQTNNSITDEQIARASLVSAAEEKVKQLLREEFNTKQVEMESLRKVREELQQSQDATKAHLADIQRETAALEGLTGALAEQKMLLEVNLNELSDKAEPNSNVDEAVQVSYPLYKQLVDAYVEDAAIEDSIYYLGKALHSGVLDCESFLKTARNISREQFYLRQTVQKCRAKAGLA